MFDLLVVATDGSESGDRAVRTALDVARRFDASVHAVSVVDTDRAGAAPAEEGEAGSERAAAAARTVAEQAPGGVDVTTEVIEGRPAEAIVAYAETVEADGVALGTRGRGGAGGFVLGSVAETVVRTCERPVLTCRGERAGPDGTDGADVSV